MNRNSLALATLINYKVLVRDTMEYTLPRDNYDVNVFKLKKRGVIIEVDQNTPLKGLIDANGENGKKFEQLIRDWYEKVYGDSSTILKLADDGLRVDHAQHLEIWSGVLPIHQNVEAMVQGVANEAKKLGDDVQECLDVDLAEERLYRGVCYMSLVNQLIKFFDDYNKARREANGAETPASNFIGQDINKIAQNLIYVRDTGRITDERFKGVEDKVFLLLDYMTGRRDRPMGISWPEVIRETQEAINGYVREVEPQAVESYQKLMAELREEVKNQQANQAPAPVAEEPAEIDPKTGLPKA